MNVYGRLIIRIPIHGAADQSRIQLIVFPLLQELMHLLMIEITKKYLVLVMWMINRIWRI